MPRLTRSLLWMMILVAPLAARDLVVAREGVVLQAQCGDGAPALAELPEGHAVTLRFALAGADTRCYSVRTEVAGQTLHGYVDRDALRGIEAVEQQRREASAAQLASTAVESIRIATRSSAPAGQAAASPAQARLDAAMEAFDAGRAQEVERLLEGAPADDRMAAMLRSSALLRLTRPGEAQAALDPALKAYPDDPALLGLAGVAAFQQDRTADAARLLERSIKLRPNQALESLLARIRTEQASDHSGDKTFGSRFVLRYDGAALPDSAARALAAELERELPAVSNRLGCQVRDRLTVVVQTMSDYRAGAGTPGWSGGHYDGRVHVALSPGQAIDARVRETISHEFVHACLARRGEWPGWLQEGVAQYISGRRLSPQDRATLAELNRQGRLPTTAALSGSWAALDPGAAQIAYSTALAAAQVMFQDLQDYGVRNLLANPSGLPAVAAKLDKRLRETLR